MLVRLACKTHTRTNMFPFFSVQVRIPHAYSMDKASSVSKAFDDAPEVGGCRKKIDLSKNRKGLSALCFVFCVEHGHCYGFHIVPMEGRRDAFLALFAHMEVAPEILYYDFACQVPFQL